MIVLFTDFGLDGIYTGQMEAVLRQMAPNIPVINGLNNAPAGDPFRSGYLLAALAREYPEGSVFLAVVDPGVGGSRLPVVVKMGGRWFVGPDNGLFNTLALQLGEAEWQTIEWRPSRLSASFHGRDLFAPVAAKIAMKDFGWASQASDGPDLQGWSGDLAEIIYIDHYGNALTGTRYGSGCESTKLMVSGSFLPNAATFSDVTMGQPFWYHNSIGLVEIAVNQGRADQLLGLTVGSPIVFC